MRGVMLKAANRAGEQISELPGTNAMLMHSPPPTPRIESHRPGPRQFQIWHETPLGALRVRGRVRLGERITGNGLYGLRRHCHEEKHLLPGMSGSDASETRPETHSLLSASAVMQERCATCSHRIEPLKVVKPKGHRITRRQ
jgi:hypothetical protein